MTLSGGQVSATWVDGRLRIDAYKPDPASPVVGVGAAIHLTREQAEELRRVIDADPEKNPPC